jgi:pimeloyl-ACP methyl ester carboxylesterase
MSNPLRLLLIFACSLLTAAATPARPVILFVHGAWGGGWQFTRIVAPLEARGYEVRRATLTGLGERSHLASRDIGLETHIEDVVNYLRFENLHDVILVGHSYGGMVISGVADRMPERIARLIYLDAVLPEDGESLMTANPNPSFDLAKMTQDGFVIPFWVKPDKPHPKDVPHPVKTFTDPITLRNPAAAKIPAAYLLTFDPGKRPEEDGFAPFAARARARGWPVLTLEADHNPHWRKPEETAALLDSLR